MGCCWPVKQIFGKTGKLWAGRLSLLIVSMLSFPILITGMSLHKKKVFILRKYMWKYLGGKGNNLVLISLEKKS